VNTIELNYIFISSW